MSSPQVVAGAESVRTPEDVRATRSLHLRPLFAIGQIWATADATASNDWWRIEAITDHPASPVIARSRCGAIRPFGLNGHYDGEDAAGAMDLVTLVREGGM